MTLVKHYCVLMIVALFSMSLVGCGESEYATFESPSVVGLQVEPTNAVIPAGTTQAYTATAIYNDNTTVDVTAQTSWSVSNPNDASISTSGIATGINSDDEIEKISAVFQDQMANVELMVSPAVPTELVITPTSLNLPQGSTTQLVATVTYSDGTTFDATQSDTIQWDVGNNNLLAVDQKGGVTANVTMNGSTSVSAIFQSNGVVVSGQSQLTVTDAIPTELVITPVTSSIPQGTEQSMVAMVTYSDGTQINVSQSQGMSWQSSNADIAAVDSKGLVMASNDNNGDVNIKGVFSSGGVSFLASAQLSVIDAIPVSLVVTPTSTSLAQGMTQKFIALATYSNGRVVDVTQNSQTSWVSSNVDLATVNSLTGIATANSYQGVGDVTVTATFVFNNNSQPVIVSNTAVLSITQAIPVELVILSANNNIAQGQSTQLSAKITYSDNTSKTLSESPNLSWSSDSSSIASVNNVGLVVANSQQITGNVTITANYTDVSQQISGNKLLTVSEAIPVELVVSALKSQVAQGQSTQLTAMVTYSDNTTANVSDASQGGISWVSSDNTLATVSDTGLLMANKQKNTGDVTVTATFMDVSTKVVGSVLVSITDAVPIELVIDSDNTQIAQGQSSQLNAIVTYSDNTTATVTDGTSNAISWQSSSDELMIVDQKGIVTANSNGKEGQGVVSAVFTDAGEQVEGKLSMTVSQAVPVKLVMSSEKSTLAQGQTLQLTATVIYSDNTTEDVSDGGSLGTSWVSDNNELALVTNDGLLTANSQQQTGDVNITATFVDLGVTVASSMTVSITQAIPVNMVLSALKKSIAQGQSTQITAKVTYSDASVVNVTNGELYDTSWVSGDASIATIDNQGLLTANSNEINGDVSVSAVYQDGVNRVQGEMMLAVTKAIPIELVLSSDKSSIAQGQSMPLKAVVIYSDNTTADVSQDNGISWVSDNTVLAKVNEDGILTANSTQQTGDVTVLATYIDTGISVNASMKIAVTEAIPKALVITPTSVNLAQGTYQQFKAIVTYSDNTSNDVTTLVSWINNTESLVAITGTGLVTANSQQQLGDAEIKATYTDINVSVDATAVITVTAATPQRLVISPIVVSLAQGRTQQYTATVIYSDDTTADFTQNKALSWSTQPSELASINEQGVVTANSQQKVGEVTVSAQFFDNGVSVTNSTSLDVTPAVPVSLALSPDIASIPMGYTKQFYAVMTYSDSSVLDVSDGRVYDISWSSSNNYLASVNNQGLASTLFSEGTGDVNITAKLIDNNMPFEATGVLTVADPIPTELEVTPSVASIAQGTTQQFQAWMTYSDGVTRDVTTNIDWSSDNTAIATVGTTGFEGLVTANKSVNGTANIVATDTNSDFSASASLSVTSAVPESLSVTPVNGSSYQGQTKQYTATVTYSNNTTYNASSDSKISWVSSNPAIATIDKNGITTAYLTKGSIDITATYVDSVSLSDTTGLTIKSKTSYPLNCYAELNDSKTLITGWANTSGDGPTLSRKKNKYAFCLRPDLAGLDVTLKAHSGCGCQVSVQKQSGWKTVNGEQFKVTKIIANSCPGSCPLYNGY
ncbi:Ig-like domain-containing protein [uncultured Shewanella sp.]|uniref:beta strand repeat-containing protein n=1 Tax=uncultured Shewanella sp. TaxID=173975 RepID=UPI002620FB96|nr:Ig-like domain-containing protein [uncultured Shewanella sp.]